MRLKRSQKALLAILLAICVVTGPLRPVEVFANTTSKYQSQIDAINDKLSALDAEKKAIQQSINQTANEKEKEQKRKYALDEQILITKNEIQLLEQRAGVLEEKITVKLEEIDIKQGEIDETFQQFLKRLRAMYMTDDTSVLGLVLGADSFADFLTKTETVIRITDHDKALMERLTQERTELEELKTQLEADKKEVEDTQRQTEVKKQDLSVQVDQVNMTIYSLDQLQKEFMADLEKNKQQAQAMQSELANIYRQIEWDNNPYIGGEMQWPVPGFYQISSAYGPRWNGADFHTGIDITGSGVFGNSIVAANGGTVKFVNWAYRQGVGYGIYLIVDHGGGVTTLYAHTSNIVVKVGDVVTRGQKIAEVGSTGWSTGPHLHFEVRLQGSHTNPSPYLTKK